MDKDMYMICDCLLQICCSDRGWHTHQAGKLLPAHEQLRSITHNFDDTAYEDVSWQPHTEHKSFHTTCSCWLESSFHVQKVEEDLKDVKESSADCILDYIKYLQSLEWYLSVGFTERSSLLLIDYKEDWKIVRKCTWQKWGLAIFWHFFHKFERLQHITLVLISSHTRETGLFGQVFEGNEAEHDALIMLGKNIQC